MTLVPPPATRRPRVQPGLRLQILLALAGLMVLAFVPLFFAVASLTRATVAGAREETAGLIGRTVTAHVGELLRGRPVDVARGLRGEVGQGIDAICVFRPGEPPLCEGAPGDVAAMEGLRPPLGDSVEPVHGTWGRSLQITSRSGDALVVTRLHAEGGARGVPLVRLVALYMIVFALALIVFAYFALTRVIVRPVEQLVGAADRVASGARTLRVPRYGARELAELGASVQAMAEKLIAEEANLILKVEELTDTTRRLTDTRAQLVRSERMASVGRLAAGLAHEIGNPIAALMGMEDLLLEGGLDAESEKDFLRRMRRETDRIHAVIRDLLDFARPEGQVEERCPPQPAEVAAVVSDVLSLVKPQKPFRAVRVETDVAPGLQVAVAASKLTQVLLNLVLNAGAAIVGARREDGRVVIRARADGSASRIRIEVEDDGPGIAPAVRDRLFEPFVTTKPVGEGTGLGLAVCRGLVESAGGEISLDPAHEEGARFVVVLPVSPPSTP